MQLFPPSYFVFLSHLKEFLFSLLPDRNEHKLIRCYDECAADCVPNGIIFMKISFSSRPPLPRRVRLCASHDVDGIERRRGSSFDDSDGLELGATTTTLLYSCPQV